MTRIKCKGKQLLVKGQSKFTGLFDVLLNDAISILVLEQRRIRREVKDKWLVDSFWDHVIES